MENLWDDYWITNYIIEGSLEVKLPTIWTDEKQSRAEAEKRKIRREKSRRERVRRKNMQIREKVGKSRNTVFFQWFVAPEGRKVGSLKRRVRSQLARWEMKNCTPLWREAHFQVKMYKTIVGPLLEGEMSKKCTPLWREAHFQVKMYKTHRCRTTFGRWDVEKVHAVVARSTFRSQNGQNTPGLDHFWKLRCRKSARRCGAKHISKSKCAKHTTFGPLLDVQSSFRVAGTRDCAPCQKWAKREGFVAFPKTMAGVGHLNRICKDAFSVADAVQETSSSELLGGPGADYSERGCILEHQICRFAKMILPDRCSTSYDLASLFHGRRSTLDRWSGKIAKRIGTRLSALHWTFRFWRKSRRIALILMLSNAKIEEVSLNCCVFFMLSTLKNEEVSQNCFVFDVVKFKHWGSLADLLRFWCCQLWTMKTSRRIARFSSLQIDR